MRSFALCFYTTIRRSSSSPPILTTIPQDVPSPPSPNPPKILKDVPVAKGLPFIGTIIDIFMAGSWPHIHEYVDRRHKELGPIFREKIGPVEAVFTNNPTHHRKVYSYEGKTPRHSLPPAWILYNKIHENPRGTIFMDGEEWLTYRRILNKVFLKVTDDYVQDKMATPSKHIAKKVVERWSKREVIDNLDSEAYRWAIEGVLSAMAGSGDNEQYHTLEPEAIELGQAAHLVFLETSRLQLIPVELSKALHLPAWTNFEKAATKSLAIGKSLLHKLIPMTNKYDGILNQVLKFNLEKEMFERIIIDIILGAGDTTSVAIQWCLYLLARHPETQEKLKNTLLNIEDPKKDYEDPFLKAVVRETLRLYPVAPFITRYMPNNVDIAGYKIDQDTLMILSIYSSGRDPESFPQPERFWPERWMREGGKYVAAINPMATHPFGMGSRGCVGRKLAEIMIYTLLSEVVKNFHVSLVEDKEVEMVLKLITVPVSPINIKLTKY